MILIAPVGTDLPYDIQTETVIFYREDFKGSDELKNKIDAAVSSTHRPPHAPQRKAA